MTTLPEADVAVGALTIRRLSETHRDAVHKFYAHLDAESQYQRFGTRLTAQAVDRYISRLSFGDGEILGAFDGQQLIGLCESAKVPDTPGIRELAFVVAPAYRQRKVGYQLGKTMLLETSDTLVVACTANNPFMNRLARSLGFRLADTRQPGGLPLDLIERLATPYGLFVAQGSKNRT